MTNSESGKELYNGIVLPKRWPPDYRGFTREPAPAPYLRSVPVVIPIDVGRQLFVDDFLVESTTLTCTFHLAEYHPKTPVLRPDRPWEESDSDGHPSPCAMVFSDGVWYDPADELFKMWYMGGYTRSTCYATSPDGIVWEKRTLDVVTGTNVVDTRERDSATVWLDHFEEDPTKRFKLFNVDRTRGGWVCHVHTSSDGIHWGEALAWTEPIGDRTTVFFNPFREKWVYGIRHFDADIGRVRLYREHDNAIAAATWKPGEAVPWIGADVNDPPRPDLVVPPQLYNLDAVAYESLMLGLFTIWPGQPQDRAKPNYLCLGFSRDGFHWHRPDHRPFIGVSERYGHWNWANVQSAGGGCLIVGDQLYFYVSGRAGVKGSKASGVCTTGLATIRRDGFVSMDAGETTGVLTTRPVQFSGRNLFVNSDASAGELRAEILDVKGELLSPFSSDNCLPVRTDSTRQPVVWRGGGDLSALRGKPVRFRFTLRKGRLYAFWVSEDGSGASRGYVAAGGPGFTGLRDTVGAAR